MLKKSIFISLYAIFIGYKRIGLIALSLFPLWYGLMGLSYTPAGAPSDRFAHDNMEILLLIGIIWIPLYFWLGLKFEKIVFKIVK